MDEDKKKEIEKNMKMQQELQHTKDALRLEKEYNIQKEIDLENVNKCNEELENEVKGYKQEKLETENRMNILLEENKKLQSELKAEIKSNDELKIHVDNLKGDMAVMTKFQFQQAQLAQQLAQGFKSKYDLKSCTDIEVDNTSA